MNRINLLLVIGIYVVTSSCESEIEKKLRENIESRSKDFDIEYKLERAEIVDTVTVAEYRDSMTDCIKLAQAAESFDRGAFETLRNQEFTIFRRDSLYETEVMHGNLKDASPWCTELRVRTELSDSLLKHWDMIDHSGWDVVEAIYWYMIRHEQFFDNLDEEWMTHMLKNFNEKYEARYKAYKQLQEAPADSVAYYAVEHRYSFYNPLVKKRLNFIDSVRMSSEFNILEVIDKSDFSDMMRQITK